MEIGVGLVGHLLAFKDEQTGVGTAQITADAYQVVQAGTAATGEALFVHRTQRTDSNHHARTAAARTTTHQIHIIALAAQADARIQFLQRFDRVAIGDDHRHGNLGGRAIHGSDITQGHSHSFVAQMLERSVHHVEVDTLSQRAGSDEIFHLPLTDNGAIVAHTQHC